MAVQSSEVAETATKMSLVLHQMHLLGCYTFNMLAVLPCDSLFISICDVDTDTELHSSYATCDKINRGTILARVVVVC